MENDFMYMIAVVAAGFAVNFSLRALPFVLFAGRRRDLPRWVGSLGAYVSPVIIACLIVYSYSGLQWRTAWPYLAGLLTVALQLARRNSLVSIVAGTALYMCLVNCGCVSVPSDRLESSAAHPFLRVTQRGIKFRDEYVTPAMVPRLLEKNDVPRDRTLHVLVDGDFDDQQALWVFKHNYLDKAGYTKSVMIHERHGTSGDARAKPDDNGVVVPYHKKFQTPKRGPGFSTAGRQQSQQGKQVRKTAR